MLFVIIQIEDGVVSFSKCTMFSLENDFDSDNITDCLYGWEFDTSSVSSSIVIDVSDTILQDDCLANKLVICNIF